MKACVIQPPYSNDISQSDYCFEEKIKMLELCDESYDIIVLPEYSDVPCATNSFEETYALHKKYIDVLMEKCRETAQRCQSLVFVNVLSYEGTGYRNTTFAIGKNGELLGKYFKRHLPPLELSMKEMERDYTSNFEEPFVLEIEGLRYAFLTCYDFYFYEAFPAIARQNVDMIIGCSLQRSDTHSATEIMCKFLAYNTNAYVLRSSVSFGVDSPVCGASMIVSPKGEVLCNMKSNYGIGEAEFHPKDKYYKPAGFGNPPAAHYEYIEIGRAPWQYRNAGAAMVEGDKRMKYPRICAHRGFSTVASENSMPAFGAAVAMGADEIEFDLWPTSDGEIVSCHDDTLDRVSNGTGKIYEHTLAELKELDFGVEFGERLKNLRIPTFEEILKKFSCQTIMNIHIKSYSENHPKEYIQKIVALVRKYDCQNHCYFMISNDSAIAQFKSYAPDIPICVGHDANRPWEIVDRAIKLGAEKVQFFTPYVSRKLIDKAHKHGIICNMFYADDPTLAKEYFDMGIDTLLTNDYNIISQVLK